MTWEKEPLVLQKESEDYVKKLPKTISNIEYSRQLIRSASSVGANYIEAGESLSRKDFVMRIKISRKEAKESNYWLELIEPAIDPAKRKRIVNSRSSRTQENLWFNC